MALVADIETDGLLHELTTIHCLAIRDTETDAVLVFRNNLIEQSVRRGVELLIEAQRQGKEVVFHNGVKFDVPAINKVYPDLELSPEGLVDTLVLSRLVFPDIASVDHARIRNGKQFPKNLIGNHSLESWGHRLGEYKGDFKGPWTCWTQSMEDYCVQDTAVGAKLYKLLRDKNPPEMAVRLEHDVAWIIARQERHGFCFDMDGARRLLVKLTARRIELDQQLRASMPPMYLYDGKFTPSRDNRKSGYVKGVEFTKVKLTEFNPASRDHIAIWLKRRYGWQPQAFTGEGKPKVDETVLASLPYPEAKLLNELLMLDKRIGQLSEGNQSWFRTERNGRIYHTVNTNGAVTGRATHAYPNLAQVPKVGSLYGAECRALFTVPPKKKLVGCDLSGIELRCLAHFMARWDGGAYARVILDGKSEDGTDIHSVNCRALGLDPKKLYTINGSTKYGRDIAKTFIYAFLYGAGDEKLGSIVGKGRKAGAELRRRFLASLPALKKLVDAVKNAARRGYLVGLDGRHLKVRSIHSALNTLLQSAGALISKRWMVEFDLMLKEHGLEGRAQQVAWVHDEIQIECDEEVAEEVGRLCVLAAEAAGRYFNLRMPTAGEYKVGNNWSETH